MKITHVDYFTGVYTPIKKTSFNQVIVKSRDLLRIEIEQKTEENVEYTTKLTING